MLVHLLYSTRTFARKAPSRGVRRLSPLLLSELTVEWACLLAARLRDYGGLLAAKAVPAASWQWFRVKLRVS